MVILYRKSISVYIDNINKYIYADMHGLPIDISV